MTMTGDYIPAEDNQALPIQDEGPVYPRAFGIELTPKVQGIAIALLGLAATYAMYNFLVRPVVQEKQTLQQQVLDKEAQVQQQRASLENIEALRAELNQAINQRVAIYSLLGDRASLDTLLLDINQQIENSNAAIADAIRADLNAIDNGRLASLGLNRAQIQRVRSLFADDPVVQRLLYTSELFQFTPSSSGIVNDGSLGPELDGKLERYTVDVSMQALFPQTLNILRNIERLEPFITISDLNQTIAAPPPGASEADLVGISRLLDSSFTLEVLVPVNDPTQPPEPPPAAEGEADAAGEAPPEAPAE